MNTAQILLFLKDLENNNNREWFQAHKSRYVEVYGGFLQIVEMLIEGINHFDASIGEQNPKKCAFRIYRDVRFSKDKSPYKNYMGANISPGGRKSQYAGYYVHFQPGNTIAAGGVWHPAGDNLAKIRQEIDYNPGPLKKILESGSFREEFGELKGDSLKRPPKDYEADHPDIKILKHKDFIAYRNFTDVEVKDKNFIENIMASFKVLLPFNQYFNEAIS